MNSSRLCLRDSAKRKPAVGRKKIAACGHNKSGINISVVFNTENAGREREREIQAAQRRHQQYRYLCGAFATKDAPLRIIDFHRERKNRSEAIEDKNQLSLSGQIESPIRIRCVFNDFANEIYGAMTNHMENSTRYGIFLGISGWKLADVVDRVGVDLFSEKSSKLDSFFIV